MSRVSTIAIILVAFCLPLAKAQAQNAYRCGDSYSQTPCPGGKAVDTDDSRSKEQKAAADAATKRDLRMADSMEKTRLQQEEAQRKAASKSTNKSSGKSSANENPSDKQTHNSKKKSKTPEYFTARTGEKKKIKTEPTSPTDKTAANPGAQK
jgi:hypothetical protein